MELSKTIIDASTNTLINSINLSQSIYLFIGVSYVKSNINDYRVVENNIGRMTRTGKLLLSVILLVNITTVLILKLIDSKTF